MSARPMLAGIVNQRTAQAAAAGIQLAHAARDEIDQNVRVANFFNGSFAKFSVHYFSENERVRIAIASKPMQS